MRANGLACESEGIERTLDCIVALPGQLFRGTYLRGPANRFKKDPADLFGP